MKLTVTHPGKRGDLLWALATVKALSEARSTPAHLVTSPYCVNLIPFLEGQPYIASARVDWNWEITGDCPGLQPWSPPMAGNASSPGEEVVHLGLREWPEPNLFQVYGRYAAVDPSPHWLTPVGIYTQGLDLITLAFTDEWVELKVGLVTALATHFPTRRFMILGQEHSRLWREFRFPFYNVTWQPCTFAAASRFIKSSILLVTDKSALRVMGTGLGQPMVVVEPSQPRHNPVFDPPAAAQPEEYVLNGFDARELCALVEGALAHPLRH